jgi:hypothetical protein
MKMRYKSLPLAVSSPEGCFRGTDGLAVGGVVKTETSGNGSEVLGRAAGLVTLKAERPTEVADFVGGRLPPPTSAELLRVLLRKTGVLLLRETVEGMMMAWTEGSLNKQEEAALLTCLSNR